MPGPQKRPTKLTDALGNPGKRAKRPHEPQPTPVIELTPPSWLDPIAQFEWARVAQELVNLGLLTTLDLPVLDTYCQAHSDFRRLTSFIEENGSTYEAGDLQRIRPEVKLRQDAVKTILRTCREFGFSPSARAAMHVTLEQNKPVTLADILNGTA